MVKSYDEAYLKGLPESAEEPDHIMDLDMIKWS
jgi:hypothetical protein